MFKKSIFGFICLIAYFSHAIEPLVDLEFRHLKKNYSSLATFSPDGYYIAVARKWYGIQFFGNVRGIDIFSARDYELLNTLESPEYTILSMKFSPDSHKLVITSHSGSLNVLDVLTGEILHSLTCIQKFKAAYFSPDGTKILAVSSTDIKILDSKNYEILHTYENGLFINAAIFSPDCKYLAVAFRESITIINAADYSIYKIIELNNSYAKIKFISFSPDSDRIVAALSLPGEAWVWSIDDSAEPKLKLISDWPKDITVSGCSYSQNGRYIMTSSYAAIQIWRAENGELLYTIKRDRPDENKEVEFSPDGNYISDYNNGGMRIFLLPSLEFIEKPLSLTMIIYSEFLKGYLNKKEISYDGFIKYLTSIYGETAKDIESICFKYFDNYTQKYLRALVPDRPELL